VLETAAANDCADGVYVVNGFLYRITEGALEILEVHP
jgi:hypothetical protein